MIQLTNSLWIGDSDDGYLKDNQDITAVLNVAQDLSGECCWPDVEYAQVGLIDGPGNEISDYCAAVLTLVAIIRRHEVAAVLVYDHNGGRALAVAMMYLNLTLGQYRSDPLSWSHWLTWGERLTEVAIHYPGRDLLILPRPHKAHVEAFGKLPFGVLEALL